MMQEEAGNEIKEVKKVILQFMEEILLHNNIEKAMETISNDIIGVGMGEQGLVSSREELREILMSQKSVEGASYSVQYPKIEIRCYAPGFASIYVVYEVTCRMNEVSNTNGFIQTASAKKEGEQWKLCFLQAVPITVTKESIDSYPLQFAEHTLAKLKSELQMDTFDLMNQSISGGILSCYLKDEEYPLYFINDSMLDYLGYDRDVFEKSFHRNAWGVIHPEDKQRFLNQIQGARQSGKDFQIRCRLRKKDDALLWMAARGRVGHDENDQNVLIVVFVDITELIELQEQLEKQARALSVSEERFRIALEKTSNIIFDCDMISGNIVHSSTPKKAMDFVTNIRDAKRNLIIGGEIEDSYLETFQKAFHKIQEGARQSVCIVKAVNIATKREIWNKITLTGISDGFGKNVRAIGMIEDVTKQKEMEMAYEREEQYRKAMVADAMASYVINFTKGIFESCRVDHPYCVPVAEGEPYDAFVKEVVNARYNEEDRRAFLDIFSKSKVLEHFRKGERELSLDYRVLNSDGNEMWMRTVMRLVLERISGEVKGFMYVTDIDKKKREQLEWKRKSERDSMTQVYNKGAAVLKIEEKLKTYEGIQSGVFLMLDVDHFKEVNDTYGHPFGDKVLIQVAELLSEQFREQDIVGRIGGDEFCVFFTGVSSEKQIRQIARTICKKAAGIQSPQEKSGIVTLSIGITICRGFGKDFAKIYKEADEALYRVKENGRNGYAFYNKEKRK